MPIFPLHVDEEQVRVAHAVGRLLVRGGLEAVTIRAVAAEARLAVGTLAHRMGSKDELWGAVARTSCLGLRLVGRGSSPLEQLVVGDDADALQQERAYLALRELARSRPAVAAAVAFQDEVDERHLVTAGAPLAHVRGLRALVVGLRDAAASPTDPLPRAEALLVLQTWLSLLEPAAGTEVRPGEAGSGAASAGEVA